MSERPPVDQVYSRLRWLIIEGHYPPGSRLVEERLASDLGVSRTPVRQALARVAAEGLVHIYPNRGAVVRRFTTADLLEIYDLRALLEGHAAYLAASRIGLEQLAILKDAAEALEQSLTRTFESRTAEVRFLVEQNAIFHDTILFAAGNERLTSIVHMVVDIPLQFRSFYWYTPEERHISNFFHRAILKALQQGDGERARAMMREHIYHGRDALLQNFNDDQTTDIEQ
ncbi:MAG: GntR family transcriptional regulator [Roseiflexus sp.]|uniref:GntR family transcriptional regulator n=1 Tax=Roseiflexus sp. TaxID=2562120 RepID=UPI0025D076E4|nr:GntR family transcriptional regulator [Roseiflexus sp.]MCL6539597.1 GntR family transcriptional regulator [Roseiflexus sp.]